MTQPRKRVTPQAAGGRGAIIGALGAVAGVISSGFFPGAEGYFDVGLVVVCSILAAMTGGLTGYIVVVGTDLRYPPAPVMLRVLTVLLVFVTIGALVYAMTTGASSVLSQMDWLVLVTGSPMAAVIAWYWIPDALCIICRKPTVPEAADE